MKSIITRWAATVIGVAFLGGFSGHATAAFGGPSERELTVERIFATPPIGGAAPSRFRWMADSRGVSFLEKGGGEDEGETHLVLASLPSGKRRVLCIADTVTVPEDLRQSDGDKMSFGAYTWAPEGDLMAFTYKGEIFTFDKKTGRIQRRTTTEVSEKNVTFSPDGQRLAFTREHDLCALDLASGTDTRITDTGTEHLLNGVLDWVYMEELFTRGDVQGYWWSPDSRKIAFLQIDEAPVKEFPIVDFLPIQNTLEDQRYPLAGAQNPIVRVGIYETDSEHVTWMDVDTQDDSYIARVYWLGDSKQVAIEKLNRNQDDLRLLFADVATGGVHEVLHETSPTWINITYMKHYYAAKDRFVWASERDGHMHLYLFKNDGTLLNAITGGPWDVTSLDGVDEKRGHVYFTALKASILERHIYRAAERGGQIRQMSRMPGTHNPTFSPDNKYYIDRFSNTAIPSILSVHDATGKELFKIFESDTTELAEYSLPTPEFFTITSSEGVELQCSMIKPPGMDESSRYPVIVYVYGGPNAQVVVNQWGSRNYLWHAYMASRGYIVFSLDNRGSFGKGPAWEAPLLKQMGKVELEDQLAGVEYLKSLPYVDPARIGIWGWSYGGYMTCTAMFKAPGVFKAGAAVAPVTDWRFYDSIYTERYMKLPKDNEAGYEASAPLNFTDGLQGAFLLIHGTSDDNVHMANSIALVNKLIQGGKDFDLMLYPGKQHGISGAPARTHLYKRLTEFFEKNL
jgi:dipeptidyl-peptidase-4